MSVQLQCDICLSEGKSLNDIGTLDKDYQVAARIIHICKSCAKKVNNKIKALGVYYGNEIAKDMRDFILHMREQHAPLT